MSVIRTFTAFFKQAVHQGQGSVPDPNDITTYHDAVYIDKLVDIEGAARKIVEHASRRSWDDRHPGKVILMIHGPLDYCQWYELTRATALLCTDSLVLDMPRYAKLRANSHQQFVFEKSCSGSKHRQEAMSKRIRQAT